MDSILTSVKKMLGISEEYTHFDDDLIMHINSVFMLLNQLGVGPNKYFSISDKTAVWTDFVSASEAPAVKSYMYLKVRKMFDPPTSSSVASSMDNLINELEWRLTITASEEEHHDE